MIGEVTWRDAGALLTLATLIGGLVIAWVRWRLSGDFASKADISALATRMEEIEARLRVVPTHEDVSLLGQRIGAVERAVDVVAANVQGVRESNGRIEAAVHMLTQHELAKAREGRGE